ncbi:uncharacterized protein LOC131223598 [Magnolia sinica]|uniref:uncharacterized protein LOC131223598 n=1 Tax=Magnolia sinica TaxID=86752 RepID=UPI00265A5793|nr:uncharacterized protein LOC131223598 [Magnolia sinica]
MASSSSTQTNHQLLLSSSYTATPAPPPTPSNQNLPSSTASDALSRLLHHHLLPPPLLSLPSRLRPSPPLPRFSFHPNLTQSLSTTCPPPFFQLTHHPIPSHLPKSADLHSLSLFPPSHQSPPDTWPLGHDADGRSFCFDPASSSSPSLSSLTELAESLEKVGLEVVEALSCAVGFDNPLREKGRACSLMWVSLPNGPEDDEDGSAKAGLNPGRVYPYVVGLQYQVRRRKYSLLADSGWVSVEPEVDSVLVTIGDIAQVWSNGKLKKVRGRPVANLGKEESVGSSSSSCVSMCLLVTLSMDNIISPLVPLAAMMLEDSQGKDGDGDGDGDGDKTINKFCAFSFEEYAWRVYHERFHFKDPLDRYRL